MKSQLEQFPEQMTEEDQSTLVQFLALRIDANLFRLLFSTVVAVLNVEATFANRNTTVCWYLHQIILNLQLKMIPLVPAEIGLNPTLKWDRLAPRGWKRDANLRAEANELFDAMCVNVKCSL